MTECGALLSVVVPPCFCRGFVPTRVRVSRAAMAPGSSTKMTWPEPAPPLSSSCCLCHACQSFRVCGCVRKRTAHTKKPWSARRLMFKLLSWVSFFWALVCGSDVVLEPGCLRVGGTLYRHDFLVDHFRSLSAVRSLRLLFFLYCESNCRHFSRFSCL